jgi:predicted ribosomally synthesized peptide with SipW-like signal peptide
MKKFVVVGLNVLVLFGLFFGATLAFFTDSVTNEDNIITIGNLKVSMVAADDFTLQVGGGYNLGTTNLQNLKEDGSPLFDFEGRVEPGQSLTRFIRVRNAGSIAMSYDLSFVVNEDFLEQYINFSFTKMNPSNGAGAEETFIRRGDYFSGVGFNSAIAFSGVNLDTDDFDIYRITIDIFNTLGNEFNYQDLTTDAFDFDVSLLARQASVDPS